MGIENSILNYERSLRSAKNEIENAYDQNAVNQIATTALIRASEAGDQSLRLEQIRFESGRSDLLSVLQVQQTVLNTNASRINTQASVANNRIDIYLATGGDIYEDVE